MHTYFAAQAVSQPNRSMSQITNKLYIRVDFFKCLQNSLSLKPNASFDRTSSLQELVGDQTLISCWLYGKMGVGMWMMCLGGLGARWGLGWFEESGGDSDEVELRSEEVEEVQSWEVLGKQERFSGEGENASDSDMSDGDGVVGGVSMDGIGWSLKQADS